MAFHHVAFATRDPAATHAFYTEVMGFELVKVVVNPTPSGAGWARHFFYDTGGGEMIAFWDLHDAEIGDAFPTAISKGMGLPEWVNHLAFDAPDLEALAARRERWRACGITVVEVDHGFCTSIYATDPNGIMVEFCCTTRAFTDEERGTAEQRLFAAEPDHDEEPTIRFYEPVVPS
jgi:catechol 2,3-dioxygenase-like lactoylglutathione lyase family enzyme